MCMLVESIIKPTKVIRNDENYSVITQKSLGTAVFDFFLLPKELFTLSLSTRVLKD